MLATSILQRLCGGLVEALTGRTDGDQLLAELSRTNIFVVPLDTRPSWFRYHRMFGELLRARLHRQYPERVPELHRRAARWHAEQDQPVDALRHALAGHDWGYATDLLVGNWHHLARYGHPEPLPALAEPPPADAIRAAPELALAYAADRLDLRDLDTAEGYLRLADRHRHLLDEDRQDRFALITTALELAQAQQRGDAARTRRAATAMLDLIARADVGRSSNNRPLPAVGGEDPAAGPGVETGAGTGLVTGAGPGVETGPVTGAGPAAVALAALGTAELTAGDLDAAEATLRAGLTRAEAAGLSCPRLVCASTLAFVQAVRGELRAAQRTAQAALAMPPCPGQSRPVHRGYAYLALAVVDLQRDRLDLARSELDFAAGACEPGAEPGLAGSIAVVSAQLLHEQGELAKGYEALSAGRDDLADRPPSRFLDQWFAAVEADLRTAHGDTETVRRLLAPATGTDPSERQDGSGRRDGSGRQDRSGRQDPSGRNPSVRQDPSRRDQLGRDRLGRDRLGQDAVGRDSSRQDPLRRDSLGRNRLGQDAVGQNSSGRDRLGRDPSGRDQSGRDAVAQNSSGQDRLGRDQSGRDSSGQDPSGRDRLGQDSSGRDRSGQDLLGQGSSGQDRSGREQAPARPPAPMGDAALAVTLAHAYLRNDDPGAALRTLPAWHDDTGAPLPLRLSAGLVEALAARRAGDTRRATRILEQVLRLAEPEGFRRVFTRAGAPARELLIEHLDSGTACWSLVNELVSAGEQQAPRAAGAPVPATLAEPLTERELTVLRYLQSILSNTEIAVEMSLSVNTVKTHVRNIYRKLDAARRRDAVRRARELHLL
jgi:ATP/maltotriose-dependent transcriptional regulator MalT